MKILLQYFRNFKAQAKGKDTIIFDTISVTDTTGNMGKLGKYLRDNGKEHGYCTDHNLHLVAKLAFERESTVTFDVSKF